MKIRLRDFADPDGVLATRARGERARHDIERRVASLRTPTDVVALDFDGIKAATVPFLEQCLGILLSGRLAGYYEEHPFVLLNGDEDVRETIAAVLRLRHLSALSVSGERVELLGGDHALKETMATAAELREFSVNDVAKELHVSVQAANNRLRQLVQSGALSRRRVTPERGGREFRYVVPVVEDNGVGPRDARGRRARRRRRTVAA